MQRAPTIVGYAARPHQARERVEMRLVSRIEAERQPAEFRAEYSVRQPRRATYPLIDRSTVATVISLYSRTGSTKKLGMDRRALGGPKGGSVNETDAVALRARIKADHRAWNAFPMALSLRGTPEDTVRWAVNVSIRTPAGALGAQVEFRSVAEYEAYKSVCAEDITA
jgi:hypothetical protein